MCTCYYNNKGDVITKCFFEENHFIADMNSLNLGIPAAEYILAVTTDCKYMMLHLISEAHSAAKCG